MKRLARSSNDIRRFLSNRFHNAAMEDNFDEEPPNRFIRRFREKQKKREAKAFNRWKKQR